MRLHEIKRMQSLHDSQHLNHARSCKAVRTGGSSNEMRACLGNKVETRSQPRGATGMKAIGRWGEWRADDSLQRVCKQRELQCAICVPARSHVVKL
jgi:hypothetical protein